MSIATEPYLAHPDFYLWLTTAQNVDLKYRVSSDLARWYADRAIAKRHDHETVAWDLGMAARFQANAIGWAARGVS